MKYLLAASLLLLSQFVSAAEIEVNGKQVTNGIVKVEPHRLIRCKSKTEGSGYAWFVLGNAADVFKTDDCIIFTGPEGKYTVLLVVVQVDGKLDQAQLQVEIGKPKPPAPPKPPEPTPDEKYGLKTWAKSKAEAVPQYKQALHKAFMAGQKVIDENRGVALGIKAVRDSVASMGTEAKQQINAIVLGPYSEKLKELNQSGKLRTDREHAEAFLETAEGFK